MTAFIIVVMHEIYDVFAASFSLLWLIHISCISRESMHHCNETILDISCILEAKTRINLSQHSHLLSSPPDFMI